MRGVVRARKASVPRQQHDHDSGQVFTEIVAPAVRASDRNWILKCRGTIPGCVLRGPDVVPSLESLALQNIITNLPNLTVDLLRLLPFRLGMLIWREIGLRWAQPFLTSFARPCLISSRFSELDSLHLWTIFVTAFQEELKEPSIDNGSSSVDMETLTSRSFTQRAPLLRLMDYVKPTVSLSNSWITHLTITEPVWMGSDVVQLCQMKNLEVLNITAPPFNVPCGSSIVGDRLVRSWGDAAREHDAFPCLKMLSLRRHEEITWRSFQFLNNIQSLLYYDVTGSNVGLSDAGYVKTLGWGHDASREDFDLLDIHTRTIPVLDFCLGPMDWDFGYETFAGQLGFRRLNESTSYSVKDEMSAQGVKRERPKTTKGVGDRMAPKTDQKTTKKRKLRQSKFQALEDVLNTF
ncbi:MAG: hypothetical protein M1837_006612 [Sclerophora amabilis]|nr:MAG: hypothetical protein M1837_006612 [Sclerophora amabilis]